MSERIGLTREEIAILIKAREILGRRGRFSLPASRAHRELTQTLKHAYHDAERELE
jgi:hypothetical protein